MQPFKSLSGIVAALPIANVDTDMILPADFLKTVSRSGLRRGLFHRLRVDESGVERPDFVLNQEPWRAAEILITEDNFGCGSSREHAPWALLDFGFRCIIAPSFAEIFAQNCTKNGILLVRLDPANIATLMADAATPESARLTVDLNHCTVTRANGEVLPFAIGDAVRARLLSGSDDIVLSLQQATSIRAHEQQMSDGRPWVGQIHIP